MSENLIVRTTHFALHILSQYVNKGDAAIDGTAGNGYDTWTLAGMTGADRGEGTVYSFDIQQTAIEHTAALLKTHQIKYKIADGAGGLYGSAPNKRGAGGVLLIRDSHDKINYYVKENIAGAIFNLGYMPGQDKTITTNHRSTISAVDQTLALTKKDGAVAIVMYAGHESGRVEKEALLQYASRLDKSIFHAAGIGMINQPDTAPSLLVITRKTEE